MILKKIQAFSKREEMSCFWSIIQTFTYSVLSQKFFLISQELLESTNKHEKSQWQLKQKYKAGLLVYQSPPENQDCKDQTKVKYNANSNLFIWIFWITSCYLKIRREVKKELPKWCYAYSWEEKKKKILKKSWKLLAEVFPLTSPHTSETN